MGEVTERERNRIRASLVAKIALPLALIALIPSLLGLKCSADQAAETRRVAKEAQVQADLNRRALLFLCSTNGVLDGLVVAASSSIRINLATGNYARLVRLGLLTERDVARIQRQLRQYERGHERLTRDNPCTTARVEGPKGPTG